MSEAMQEASAQDVQERAAIDRSVRFPVLFFFTSAAGWLFLATLLGFASAVKLAAPELWDVCPTLSYGQLFPAHMDSLIYGWAMQAGFGVMIWLMARLCRVEVKNAVTLITAGFVWNVTVLIGVVAVWSGYGNSMPWIDFPAYLWPSLFLSYAVIAGSLMMMFRRRREGDVYVSQKYIFAAALWFPWIYATANLIINHTGGSAVMSAGVNAWFMNNLIYFWFVPVGLSSAYYIIPKIVGRPIYSYQLAKIGFWALAILAGWTGFNRFLGGPFPSWMPAISGAAIILMILPIGAVAVNFLGTISGRSSLMRYSPSLRFTVFGGIMFNLYGLLIAFSSYFEVSRLLQFTFATLGFDIMIIYGFFSMVMFGAIYFIVPRITNCEWPSAKLIRFHFWYSSYAIITIVAFMIFAGLAQGGAIDDWSGDFLDAVRRGKGYVVALAIAWALISMANLAFYYQLLMMFFGWGRKTDGPTLIHKNPGEAESAEAAAGFATEETAKA